MEADKLAGRITRMHESSTLRMAQLSRELVAKGKQIISLSLGEPDFDTPTHIKEAAIQAIENNITHYPPVAGFPELRKAIVTKFERDNQLNFSPAQVLVSTGAKQSIINILMCLLEEGDEIIIPAPYWVSYPEMVKLTGATPVYVHAGVEQSFKITAHQLEQAITPRTKAIIYSSPSNPTGSVYSYDELASFAEVLKKHPDIFVISDEIYELINFGSGHVSMANIPGMAGRTIVINGVSKAFAMTGWRIGYAAGPEFIIKAAEKFQGQFTSGACTISQKAAEAAISQSYAPTEIMTDAFRMRKDLVMKLMKEMPGMKTSDPAGAFYLFPDVSAYYGKATESGMQISTAEELVMYLLEEAQVALVGGEGFGAPNCIRFSFAASESNLQEAMRRIKAALDKLR